MLAQSFMIGYLCHMCSVAARCKIALHGHDADCIISSKLSMLSMRMAALPTSSALK